MPKYRMNLYYRRNMIDTQQQYIKLNIHGEVSIIVGQGKRYKINLAGGEGE